MVGRPQESPRYTITDEETILVLMESCLKLSQEQHRLIETTRFFLATA